MINYKTLKYLDKHLPCEHHCEDIVGNGQKTPLLKCKHEAIIKMYIIDKIFIEIRLFVQLLITHENQGK
jgi:hypothetical protein